MTILESAQCPNCGANLKARLGAEALVCGYCGKESWVRQKDAESPRTPPNERLRSSGGGSPLEKPKGRQRLLMLVIISVLTWCFVRQFSEVKRVEPTGVVPLSSADVAPKVQVSTTNADVRETYYFNIERVPLLVEVNGDNRADLVKLVRVGLGHEEHDAYVAFDALTGKKHWATPSLGNNAGAIYATIVESRLLTVDPVGQLTAYDTVNGQQQWTTALGERWSQFCVGAEVGQALVETQDKRVVSVDLKTGKQLPKNAKQRCAELHSDQWYRYRDAGDRSDHRTPQGVTGVLCGGIRFIGTARESIADPCTPLAHRNSNDVDGINASAMWQIGGNILVMGGKTNGTPVAMFGLLSKGRLVWKSEVPEGNPLESREGGPYEVTLSANRVISSYESTKLGSVTLTAFDIADGRRVWSRSIPKQLGSLSKIASQGEQLWVTLRDGIMSIRATDGQLQFVVQSRTGEPTLDLGEH